MKYTVYFEIFGKKMKTDVDANSEADARNKVMNKIVFHKVKCEDPLFNNDNTVLNQFKNIFGI